MQTTCNRLRAAVVALAVALGASAAFAAYKDRPANNEYWTWEACPSDSGSGDKGNYRLKGDESHQKEGLKQLAEKLYEIKEDHPDANGAYLHVIFTTNVTISVTDDAYQKLIQWHEYYNGNGVNSCASLRIISELKNQNGDQSGPRFNVTFNGNKTSRIFNFWDSHHSEAFHARFIGITFIDGYAEGSYGGAVYACGNASFRWCKFVGCHAYDGGAILGPGDANDHIYNYATFKKQLPYYGTAAVEDCEFNSCEATDGGGAIWGNSARYKGYVCTILRSTFNNCVSLGTGGNWGGGAINCCYYTIKHCIFKECAARGKGYGGALFACGETGGIQNCLFVKCTSQANGGAISCGSSTHSKVYLCTFIECTDKNRNAVYDVESELGDVYLYSCLFYGCNFQEGDNNVSYKDDYNVVVSDQNYFAGFKSGDYHFNVCDEHGEGGYAGEPFPGDEAYKSYIDIEGREYSTGGKMIAGCYSYYTKEQWMNLFYDKKPFEYDLEGIDPLTVTTTLESSNNKDLVVSLREALTYYGDAAIRAKSSHPNAILFELNGTSRTIMLQGSAVEVSGTGAELTVDGGDRGITLQSDGSVGGAIDFKFGNNDRRVLKNMTVKLGISGTFEDVSAGSEVEFKFSNCAFLGGSSASMSGCYKTSSIRNGANVNIDFERCSFSGYQNAIAYIIYAYKTTLTFDACTFTGNAPKYSHIYGTNSTAYFRNCTFANNPSEVVWSFMNDFPENYFNCILCQTECAPSRFEYSVTSDVPTDVFETGKPVETVVNGVTQIGYKPKHSGTARGGHASFGDWRKMPERDIFNHPDPATSAYHSQGSWYVEDRESPSLVVTSGGDVVDPFDDIITLREALAYAAGSSGSGIISGASVCPVFNELVFEDGDVTITLTEPLVLNSALFADFPLVLRPGSGQRLTITAPGSTGGAFQIGSGLEMRVEDTTFSRCNSSGSGGAIASFGLLTVDGCRFDGCKADTSSGSGGALFLGDGSKTFVNGSTFAGCQAYSGGAIANYGNLAAICVTMTGNRAAAGSAVFSYQADRTLLASATLAGNTATFTGGGAFYVDSTQGAGAGLVNSIVVGNENGGLVGSWTEAPVAYKAEATGNWYAHSLTSGTIADAFDSLVETNMPSGVKQSYYPLCVGSKASAGVFIFTKGGLDGNGRVVEDVFPNGGKTQAEIGYSTDFDGLEPLPRRLDGKQLGTYNGYVTRDQIGGTLTSTDVGMGPMPAFPPDLPGGSVSTVEDVVSDRDGLVSLREAVEYAMEHGGEVSYDPEVYMSGIFYLKNQIVVPKGKTLVLKDIILLAEGTNRHFRVEDGGTLRLEGVALATGTARGIYELMMPGNDSDGGSVCAVGAGSKLEFTDCVFWLNMAPKGYGGAIYAEGRLTLTDCIFEQNLAGKEGGAVYSKSAFMTMSGCELAENLAGENGGAVGIDPGNSTNVIKNTTISGNVAGGKGGGLFCDDGKAMGCVTLTDVINSGNEANTRIYADPNVYSGTGYRFNEQYILRVHSKYYEVLTDDNGVRRVELSDEAAPVLGAIDLASAATSGKATVKVTNAIPNLEYGLGYAETPAGPYTVDNWVRATSEGGLDLEAPAGAPGCFYRVIVREAK